MELNQQEINSAANGSYHHFEEEKVVEEEKKEEGIEIADIPPLVRGLSSNTF